MAFHCYPAIALYPTADGDMGCTADKPQVGNRRKGEKTSRLFCRDSPTLHIVTQSLGYSFQRTDHKWTTECNTHALAHTPATWSVASLVESECFIEISTVTQLIAQQCRNGGFGECSLPSEHSLCALHLCIWGEDWRIHHRMTTGN